MKNIFCFVIAHPAFISTVAVLLSFAFSIYVYVRTQKLLKQTARPMLLIKEIRNTQTHMYIFFRNFGEHPASDLRIAYGNAPLSHPEEYEVKHDYDYVDKIGVGGDTTLTFDRTDPTDKLLYFLLKYKDAFTRRIFSEEVWLKYDSGTSELSSPTRDIIEKFRPYIK